MKYFLMPGATATQPDLFRMYEDTTADKLNLKTGQWNAYGSIRPADHYAVDAEIAKEIELYATMKRHLL